MLCPAHMLGYLSATRPAQAGALPFQLPTSSLQNVIPSEASRAFSFARSAGTRSRRISLGCRQRRLLGSPEQLHKHFIRNRQPVRHKLHTRPCHLQKPKRAQSIDIFTQRSHAFGKFLAPLALDPPKINPFEHPQPQKNLFVQRLRRRKRLKLLAR